MSLKDKLKDLMDELENDNTSDLLKDRIGKDVEDLKFNFIDEMRSEYGDFFGDVIWSDCKDVKLRYYFEFEEILEKTCKENIQMDLNGMSIFDLEDIIDKRRCIYKQYRLVDLKVGQLNRYL